MENTTADTVREPWNKGKLVGQKAPFKLKEIWAIRIRLQIAHRCRDLALFNLAVDSKLRACDLMTLRVRDVCHGQIMASRALILQQKTSRPVQFEITEPARTAVAAWIVSGFENPLNFGCRETRLAARVSDRRGNHGVIGEIVSERAACRIKSLFGEKEK